MASSLLSAVRRRLVRAAFPYGGRRRVLRGPAAGLRYVVEPGMGATYAFGWERELLERLTKQVAVGWTVFDLGANRGQMTLPLAQRVGSRGRVVSFEPAPGPFASLERNVALNKLTQVRCIRAAVSDSAGTAEFVYAEEVCTLGQLSELPGGPDRGERFAVPTISIDDVVETGESPPDFIKIDVQGAAASVLRGAKRLLERTRPIFYVEQHGPAEQQAVRDELLARGYIAETSGGRRVEDVCGEWHDALWCRPA